MASVIKSGFFEVIRSEKTDQSLVIETKGGRQWKLLKKGSFSLKDVALFAKGHQVKITREFSRTYLIQDCTMTALGEKGAAAHFVRVGKKKQVDHALCPDNFVNTLAKVATVMMVYSTILKIFAFFR